MNFIDKQKQPHIVFLSRTGSEIAELIKQNIINPNRIVIHVNKQLNLCEELVYLRKRLPFLFTEISLNPTIDEYKSILSPFLNPVITLHGYLRIIPDEICKKYTIYNLHPGLITKYSELKGKDPQEKVIGNSLKYPKIGCVIHRAIAEVDAGNILKTIEIDNPDTQLLVYKNLKDAAIQLWIKFFNVGEEEPISGQSNIEDCNDKQPNSSFIEIVESKFPETCTEFKRLQYQDYILFCKKQLDYGPGNISIGSTLENEEDRRISQSSIIFRCFDKVQRLINLVIKNPKTIPTNEPIEDAYADLTNYAIIARIVRNKKWGQ